MTVKEMVLEAYSTRAPVMRPRVEGGPAWIRSDRYTITAAAEGKPALAQTRGVMLRRLLEDRFGLRVHLENGDPGPADVLVIDAVERPSRP
jgi:uncharacterized protein (TIGR03435 family)